jgi:hypothetical protein
MPNLIEDRLSAQLATWINDHRPIGFPNAATLPVHVARRDEIRTRPCIVINTSEAKPVSALPHTARMQLDVHLFSQVDDTPAATHAEWAGKLVALLQGKATIQTDLQSATFILHDLIPRETVTTPDESRGRESVLGFEAVASAI